MYKCACMYGQVYVHIYVYLYVCDCIYDSIYMYVWLSFSQIILFFILLNENFNNVQMGVFRSVLLVLPPFCNEFVIVNQSIKVYSALRQTTIIIIFIHLYR